MCINSEISVYQIFDEYSKYVILWLNLFCIITFVKILFNAKNLFEKNKLIEKKENIILEELPGITLILLHTICWYMSENYVNKLIFLYWGPLYIVTGYFVVFKKQINWRNIALLSSISCKIFYIFFVLKFFMLNFMLPIYCYSVWIMHDQIRLAWFKNNADRTRRLFEDWFVPRIGYPLFLLLPFFDKTFYYREFCMCISILIIVFWIGGLIKVIMSGNFFVKPKLYNYSFGRDIVYM